MKDEEPKGFAEWNRETPLHSLSDIESFGTVERRAAWIAARRSPSPSDELVRLAQALVDEWGAHGRGRSFAMPEPPGCTEPCGIHRGGRAGMCLCPCHGERKRYPPASLEEIARELEQMAGPGTSGLGYTREQHDRERKREGLLEAARLVRSHAAKGAERVISEGEITHVQNDIHSDGCWVTAKYGEHGFHIYFTREEVNVGTRVRVVAEGGE